MVRFLEFMSQPYAQNILACVGILVTIVYVILTFRLLKSAESSGNQTAQLVEANKALVEATQGQLRTMREQHQLAVDAHTAEEERQRDIKRNHTHAALGLLHQMHRTVMALPIMPTSAYQVRPVLDWSDERLAVVQRHVEEGESIQLNVYHSVASRVRTLRALAEIQTHSLIGLNVGQVNEWGEARSVALVLLDALTVDYPFGGDYPQENDSTTANESGTLAVEGKTS